MTHHKASFFSKHVAIAAAMLALGSTAQAATWQFSGCSGTLATGQGWASSEASNPTSTWNDSNCGQVSDGVIIDLRGYSTVAPNSSQRVAAWTGGSIGYYTTSSENGPDGTHSVDNNAGIDALILKFSQEVALNTVQIGWNGTDDSASIVNDSDMSIYRWAGLGAPTATNGTALTFSNSAWQLVNHFDNVGLMANNTVGFTAGSSSYWLISAYNGGDTKKIGTDGFKLLSVAGMVPTTPGVPEPGSLALLGLGAAGLLAARRKAVARR
jgi:hypothetical protein